MNFLLSIDGTGKKNWSNVHQMITNPRCLVRQEQQVSGTACQRLHALVNPPTAEGRMLPSP
jgi:hypothetical protein